MSDLAESDLVGLVLPPLLLFLLVRRWRSASFFTSDTTKMEEVTATRNSRSVQEQQQISTPGTVDIYLKGTRCLFTGNSQCSQGTNRSEYRKLYARIVYREPCVHKMMPVYSHCTAGPYRSTGNQCCESGMNYSGSGYDFLRVPFLDPGKCPDPTGSGFTTARMDK